MSILSYFLLAEVSSETALWVLIWVLGIISVPLLGWGISITFMLRAQREDTKELVKMHRDPDQYGFGTGKTNKELGKSHTEMMECVNHNTHAIEALTHYIKWLAEKQIGETPPPPIVGS